MKKRLLAVLIAVLMLTALIPTTALAHSGNHDVHDHENSTRGIHVRIEAGAGGTIYSSSGQNRPLLNETWTFRAVPDEGYRFDHWTYTGNGVSNAFLTAADNKDLRVKLIEDAWVWKIWRFVWIGTRNYKAQAVFAPLPQYTLSTSVPGGGGSISKNPNQSTYPEGTSVTLTANASPGWEFVEWSGDASGSSNPKSITMNSNKSVSATFRQLPTYTLSISTAGSGAASATPSQPTYIEGTSVTLTASPASGWRFENWSGDASGTLNPKNITMDADKSITANFIKTYNITLNTQGGGHLNHEGAVEGTHDVNTTIDLNGSDPHTNLLWMFGGWRDNDTGLMMGSSEFTLTEDRSFTAIFVKKEHLSVMASHNGTLGNDISGHYGDGTQVNLNDANPIGDTGYELDRWQECGLWFFPPYTDVPLDGGQPIIEIGDSNYFRALFKKSVYTVTFVDQNGDAFATAQSVEHGTDATKPSLDDPTDTRFDLTDTAWEAELLNVTENREITVTLEYQVTFDLAGGTRTGGGELSQWVKHDDSATAPDFDAPTGETFNTWSVSLNHITAPTTITAQYTSIPYTLTINYLNRADNSALSTAYVDSSMDYQDAYSIPSPALLGYDVPSDVIVDGTMPADNVTINVYYEAHTIDMNYIKQGTDVPTDLRGYKVFHKDTVTTTYPVQIGYSLDNGVTIISLGDLDATNINTNPFVFTTTPIGVGSLETCKVYWYDEDNAEWIFAIRRYGKRLFEATFDSGIGEFADTSTQKFDYAYKNRAAYIPADEPTEEGYTFVGWDINDDGVIDSSDDLLDMNSDTVFEEIKITQSITVTAIYEINTFEVMFFDYDGTQIGATQTIDWNTAASISDPTRTGYTFAGWNLVGDDDTVLTSLDNVKENIIATAQWSANNQTLTLLNGYGGTISTETIKTDATIVYPANPVRAGYTFIGWDSTPATMPPNDLMITATWSVDDQTLMFVDGYGGTISTETIKTDATIAYPSDPVRAGYTFTGWDSTPATMPPNDLTIMALWTINTYTVTFFEEDGTTQVGTTQIIDWGNAATFETAPAIAGYAFDEWVLTGDDDTADNSLTSVQENIIAVASYIRNGYTVTFVDYDGQVLGTDGVLFGDDAEAPEDPQREGYTFAGWDIAFDSISASTTVTATYEINTFTVTFEDYDGSAIGTPQTIDWSTAAVAPEDPEREGYTFAGWSDEFDAVTQDMTITAEYEEDAVTVLDEEEVPETADTATLDTEEIPEAKAGGFPWWIIIAIGGAALLFFLFFFVWKRRKGEEAA